MRKGAWGLVLLGLAAACFFAKREQDPSFRRYPNSGLEVSAEAEATSKRKLASGPSSPRSQIASSNEEPRNFQRLRIRRALNAFLSWGPIREEDDGAADETRLWAREPFWDTPLARTPLSILTDVFRVDGLRTRWGLAMDPQREIFAESACMEGESADSSPRIASLQSNGLRQDLGVRDSLLRVTIRESDRPPTEAGTLYGLEFDIAELLSQAGKAQLYRFDVNQGEWQREGTLAFWPPWEELRRKPMDFRCKDWEPSLNLEL